MCASLLSELARVLSVGPWSAAALHNESVCRVVNPMLTELWVLLVLGSNAVCMQMCVCSSWENACR